ncbi:TPA: hypothetical protein ACGO1T_000891 [Streptococcus suis]
MNFEELRAKLRKAGCVVSEWEGVTTLFYQGDRLIDIEEDTITYYWTFYALTRDQQVEIEGICDEYQRSGK